jgi:hypothetical protein
MSSTPWWRADGSHGRASYLRRATINAPKGFRIPVAVLVRSPRAIQFQNLRPPHGSSGANWLESSLQDAWQVSSACATDQSQSLSPIGLEAIRAVLYPTGINASIPAFGRLRAENLGKSGEGPRKHIPQARAAYSAARAQPGGNWRLGYRGVRPAQQAGNKALAVSETTVAPAPSVRRCGSFASAIPRGVQREGPSN